MRPVASCGAWLVAMCLVLSPLVLGAMEEDGSVPTRERAALSTAKEEDDESASEGSAAKDANNAHIPSNSTNNKRRRRVLLLAEDAAVQSRIRAAKAVAAKMKRDAVARRAESSILALFASNGVLRRGARLHFPFLAIQPISY